MEIPMLKLTLPETVYAVPGIESSIYFRNVTDSAVPESYAYEVRCDRGSQEEFRWVWIPGAEDAGRSFELELRLFNDYGMAISGKTRIAVAGHPANSEMKITLALLADSGINCGYAEHLMALMRSNGFPNYTPVGSHAGHGRTIEPGGIAHDGYGGFSWNCFLSRWLYSREELPQTQNAAEREQIERFGVMDVPKSDWRLRSPLLKVENGEKVLDIPGWLNRINGGMAPDFIVIQLGGNDMFHCRPENLDGRVAEVMGHVRALLEALRRHAPDAVIGVTTCPPGCGQDGFGANYGCLQSKYQYRRNIQRYNRELAEFIRKQADPGIVTVPLHHAIDPENSYLFSDIPAHARAERKIRRCINALHASQEGGFQLGDAIYCWLRNELENKNGPVLQENRNVQAKQGNA